MLHAGLQSDGRMMRSRSAWRRMQTFTAPRSAVDCVLLLKCKLRVGLVVCCQVACNLVVVDGLWQARRNGREKRWQIFRPHLFSRGLHHITTHSAPSHLTGIDDSTVTHRGLYLLPSILTTRLHCDLAPIALARTFAAWQSLPTQRLIESLPLGLRPICHARTGDFRVFQRPFGRLLSTRSGTCRATCMSHSGPSTPDATCCLFGRVVLRVTTPRPMQRKIGPTPWRLKAVVAMRPSRGESSARWA